MISVRPESTDGGPERKVDNLRYKNPISAFFSITTLTKYQWRAQQLIYRFEILWSIGLQTIGVMKKYMASKMENYITNVNSNKEIRKLCSNNENLLEKIKESLNEPKHLIEICQPATTPQIK